MIKFNQVYKRYPGGHEALKNMSFEVAEGEMVYLTGHSGAGKSTLLKLIAAIERPSSGAVLVKGQNIRSIKAAAIPHLRRNIGLIFQDHKLLFDRNAFDRFAASTTAKVPNACVPHWTRSDCSIARKPTRSRSRAVNSNACASPAPL
jgi:ABC-type ATPase involved in cell division